MDYFFGGFARALNNPRGCSQDIFAYTFFSKSLSRESLPEDWIIEPITARDINDLDNFYRNESGGLFLDALSLQSGVPEEESMEQMYARCGFIRKCNIFSLKYRKNLHAVFIVNQSSPGLNLSELLNGVKVIIVNQKDTPWSVIHTSLSHLTDVYSVDEIPVLTYPLTYLEDRGIPYDKKYLMLVMDINYSKEYIEFMRKRIRMRHLLMIKYIVKKIFRI